MPWLSQSKSETPLVKEILGSQRTNCARSSLKMPWLGRSMVPGYSVRRSAIAAAPSGVDVSRNGYSQRLSCMECARRLDALALAFWEDVRE